MIKLTCECGKRLSAKPEFAGRTFKCPKCGRTIKVPESGAEPAAPGETPTPTAPVAASEAVAGPGISDRFREAFADPAKKNRLIAIAGAAAAVLIVLLFFVFSGGGAPENPPAPVSDAESAPPAPVEPAAVAVKDGRVGELEAEIKRLREELKLVEDSRDRVRELEDKNAALQEEIRIQRDKIEALTAELEERRSAPAAPAAAAPAASAPPAAAPSGGAVLRVSCGSAGDYTDEEGNTWKADRDSSSGGSWGAVGGNSADRGGMSVPGTKAPGVYRTERWGLEAYEFQLENGTYWVRLHFAETSPDVSAEGRRIFSVKLQGKTVLEDLDVFKEAGFGKPVVRAFDAEVADGKLRIDFSPYIQEPEINGIEIFRKQN